MNHRLSKAPSSRVAVLDADYAQGGSLEEWAASLEAAVEDESMEAPARCP